MPIARVAGQGGGLLGSGVSVVSRAFPTNVAVDSLVIVALTHYNADALDIAAGPYKSAGTATLGVWQAHATRRAIIGNGIAIGLGIWSAPVTAGGSLTLAYDNGLGGQYLTFATDELTGADLSSTRGYTGVGNDTLYLGPGSTAVNAGSIAATEGGVFIGAMAYDGEAGDTTITEDAAFTLIYEYESWSQMTGSHVLRIVTGATTDSMEWTLGAARPWGAVGAFIKEAVPAYTGPTLSAPGVDSITATSAIPKVTLTFP